LGPSPSSTEAITPATQAPTATPSDCISWPPGGSYGFTADLEPNPETIGQRGTHWVAGVPCGFTCTFSITWPNGQKQPGLPAHTVVNGDKGKVTWTWVVPSLPIGGKALTRGDCSSPSHPIPPDSGYFNVIGPPTPPPTAVPTANTSWTLSLTADSPVSMTTTLITWHVTVTGLQPGTYAGYCSISIKPDSSTTSTSVISGAQFSNGTQDVTVTAGAMMVGRPGLWDWYADCTTPSLKWASGTFVVE